MAAATAGSDGVLARDTATGHFEILDDADLQRIIEQDLKPAAQEQLADLIHEPACDSEVPIDELSLVNTLALKKILKDEDADEPVVTNTDGAGFNPYDSG